MNHDIVLDKLSKHFLGSGFNLTLKINPGNCDHNLSSKISIKSLYPEARSIILVGFGGKSFWNVFNEYLNNNREFRDNNLDLIDNYTVLKFNEAESILKSYNINYKIVYPFGEDALSLNFLRLGELGGAGVKSLLGILLHPAYGPWISLRGAFITDLELEKYDGPITGFEPCPSCDKPCISACPANTISNSGWDWESCMKFRISEETCTSSCASRRACPYGKDEQYSEEQLHYHHKFVLKNVKEYFNHK